MSYKPYILILNLAFTQVKAQTNTELRSKVLNALRAKSETSELKITESGSEKIGNFKLSLKDLNPQSLEVIAVGTTKSLDADELSKLGINADVLSYSFFNSENAKPNGFAKKFHITHTQVIASSGQLSHFLVYYDKENFYPVKVTYYRRDKKITTIEYSNYKKIKGRVWRAQMITSENHLSNKKTQIEVSKIEINPEVVAPPRIGNQTPAKPI